MAATQAPRSAEKASDAEDAVSERGSSLNDSIDHEVAVLMDEGLKFGQEEQVR